MPPDALPAYQEALFAGSRHSGTTRNGAERPRTEVLGSEAAAICCVAFPGKASGLGVGEGCRPRIALYVAVQSGISLQ